MNTHRRVLLAVSTALALALAGCGESRKEREAKERARLQQERQDERAIQKSNDAVNDVSKKLGRKPPPLDLGVPAQPQTPLPPPQTPQQPKS
jgi:hypothetical protein